MTGTDQIPHRPGWASGDLFLRLVTIAVLAPVTVAIVWYGGRAFSSLISFICIMMIFEWTRIVERAEFSNGFYILSFTAIMAMFLAAGGSYAPAFSTAVFGGLISGFSEWLGGGSRRWAFVGVVYIIMPCIALIWLRNVPEVGRFFTLLLYLVVWMTDMFAYVCGRSIGGPLLAPRISPGKTWAGAIGGVCVAVISGLVFAWAMQATSQVVIGSIAMLCLLALVLAISTVAGDIFESAIKRHFGVKDSGGYIPGHGGILDRLDGMIFATVIFAASYPLWANWIRVS